jgi:hypothetical protein
MSRRTVLKGAGAGPFACRCWSRWIPAGHGARRRPRRRLLRAWARLLPARRAAGSSGKPTRTGRNPDFPFILEPLEPVREYVTVVSGLRNKGGESSSPHGIIEETWLNCVSPRQRNAKTGVGITVDQIAARHLGKDTPLPSLELCGEPGGMISFRTPGPAAADGEQSAQGVLRHVRPGRHAGRAPRHPAHYEQPARLRA